MATLAGLLFGFLAWFVLRYVLLGLYTVDQNERAVKTRFGRAQRVDGAHHARLPARATCSARTSASATRIPQVRVIPPGGPYFRWPWETVHKVSVATQTLNMAYDPEDPSANQQRHACWRR